MLTFNTSGQVGRFLSRYGLSHPSNLCDLFWLTLGISSVFILLGAWAACAIVGNIELFVYGFSWFFAQPGGAVRIIAVVTDIMALGISAAIAFVWAVESSKFDTPVEVAISAYRGWKDKYCPLINWK